LFEFILLEFNELLGFHWIYKFLQYWKIQNHYFFKNFACIIIILLLFWTLMIWLSYIFLLLLTS
jgi:hypothetical protein